MSPLTRATPISPACGHAIGTDSWHPRPMGHAAVGSTLWTRRSSGGVRHSVLKSGAAQAAREWGRDVLLPRVSDGRNALPSGSKGTRVPARGEPAAAPQRMSVLRRFLTPGTVPDSQHGAFTGRTGRRQTAPGWPWAAFAASTPSSTASSGCARRSSPGCTEAAAVGSSCRWLRAGTDPPNDRGSPGPMSVIRRGCPLRPTLDGMTVNHLCHGARPASARVTTGPGQ